jgi:hypothetical protein
MTYFNTAGMTPEAPDKETRRARRPSVDRLLQAERVTSLPLVGAVTMRPPAALTSLTAMACNRGRCQFNSRTKATDESART